MNKIICLLSLLCAFGVFADEIDPIVPFNYKAGNPAEMNAALRRLRSEFGLRRFALMAPGTVRLMGKADETFFRKTGETIAAVKASLADTDIEIGWWDYPTIRGGLHEKGQHIVDCEGHVSDAVCPLDDAANDPYIEYLKLGARIGKPSFFVIEDDMTLSNHAGLNTLKGCFCPLHLAAYAKRVGKAYTATEIAKFFRHPTEDNRQLRKEFADLARDSLVHLSRRIRAAVDEIDPMARICLCQSGFTDIDGDSTEADARALAGNTRPMVRICGTGYFNENASAELPKLLCHVFWSVQHLPRDIELLYEADCYPHTRFCNSTRFYRSEIAAAFMAGVDNLDLYVTHHSDKPLREPAFMSMFKENRRLFEAVREFRSRSVLVGVRAVYDPEEVYLTRDTSKGSACGMLEDCARVLAKFGLPMTTLDSKANVLFGTTAKHLSKEKLIKVLAGAVIVDSEAALALQQRGMGDLLGCTVKQDDNAAFAWERTFPVAGSRCNGVDPYHWRAPAPPIIGWIKPLTYVRISPMAGTEIWARLEGGVGEPVMPSFTVARNRLGGTVGVLAFSVAGNTLPVLYSPFKQELFRNFFDRALGGTLAVMAPDTPCAWLSAAVSNDGREMLVMINSLAGEPRDDVALEFSDVWRGCRMERLGIDGTWEPVGETSARVTLPFVCEHMVTEFVRVVKANR